MKPTSARRRPQRSPPTKPVDQVDLPPAQRPGGPEPISQILDRVQWRTILLRETRGAQQ
jgi:hypothetical protein